MNASKSSGIAATALIVFAGLLTASCTTTPVTLTYDPSAAKNVAPRASASIELLSVTDKRKHSSNWLGAIRGGIGQPLKTLETSEPVKEIVRNAFIKGLEARGMLAVGGGRYGIDLVVGQFDCNQYLRREAHIRLHLSVTDKESRSTVYSKDVRIDRVTGSLFTFDAGIFAPVEDLRKLANQVLQDAVDQALDDPGLRDNIR